MLESPIRAWRGSTGHGSGPDDASSSQTYTNAFAATGSLDGNPNRKDSGFYSTTDAHNDDRIHTAMYRVESPVGLSSIQRYQGRRPTQSLLPQRKVQNAYSEVSSESQSLQSDDDNNSEVDDNIQARQMRARERVVILRERVLRTRRIVKGQRRDVRQLREDVAHAVNTLTRKINEFLACGIMGDVTAYNDTLRAAQDELGPAEEEYNRWEMRLEEEEEELEDEEDHFYRHNDVLSFAVPEAKLDEVLSPRIVSYQPPDTEFQDLSLEDERVQEYLDKITEAGHLKEELIDLEDDYVQASSDASFRKRHNIPPTAQTVSLLDEYPKLHREILDSLHDVEDQIFELRRRCLDEGLFQESDYIYEHRDALLEEVMDAVYDAEDSSPLRVAAVQTKYYERKPDFSNKQEYVNSWLLQLLQESSINLLLLKTSVQMYDPEILVEETEKQTLKWPELLLKTWNTDGAGQYANQFYNASKLDVIAGSTRKQSDSVRTNDADFGGERLGELITMSSDIGSFVTQKFADRDSTARRRRTSF